MQAGRAELFPRASDAEWRDWRWQLRHSVRSLEELARLIPDAEVRVSPEVAHLHPISSPAWLADTVTEWVTREVSPDWW